MKPWFKTIALLGMGVLCAPAFGADLARPGTVNYIEGAAYLEGKLLNPQDVGSIEMNPGEVLSTEAGKAEILLTPGVFLRLNDNSAVKMISPDITPTQLEIEHGQIAVEVDEIYPENDLEILDGGVTTQLVKTGYYEFTANPATVMVFSGKAAVEVREDKYKVVKDHHKMALMEGAKLKSVDFNAHAAEGELYKWSSLRSQYLAEANNEIAGQYADTAGFDPGWYWDPSMLDYTFIGMDPFWSPFGFGFYPFWGGGGWGGYWGGGYGGRGYGGRGFGGGGGYGGRGFHGGGFGGGGGFHGGGGGGFGGGGGGGFGGGGGGGGGGGHR
jgi:hypothetical protein